MVRMEEKKKLNLFELIFCIFIMLFCHSPFPSFLHLPIPVLSSSFHPPFLPTFTYSYFVTGQILPILLSLRFNRCSDHILGAYKDVLIEVCLTTEKAGGKEVSGSGSGSTRI